VARYGQAFKDKAVARLLPPESADLAVVSREMGVSVATLFALSNLWMSRRRLMPAAGQVRPLDGETRPAAREKAVFRPGQRDFGPIGLKLRRFGRLFRPSLRNL
jgi:transposase-like protein